MLAVYTIRVSILQSVISSHDDVRRETRALEKHARRLRVLVYRSMLFFTHDDPGRRETRATDKKKRSSSVTHGQPAGEIYVHW